MEVKTVWQERYPEYARTYSTSAEAFKDSTYATAVWVYPRATWWRKIMWLLTGQRMQ